MKFIPQTKLLVGQSAGRKQLTAQCLRACIVGRGPKDKVVKDIYRHQVGNQGGLVEVFHLRERRSEVDGHGTMINWRCLSHLRLSLMMAMAAGNTGSLLVPAA